MSIPEIVRQEAARYRYHDQGEHPAEYVAAQLSEPVNGHRYGIFVVRSGEPLAAPCPVYSSAESESEARELAYRIANELPRPMMVYRGNACSGVTKRTAKAWASKSQPRFEHTHFLKVVPYGHGFGVYAMPKDWGQLIN